MKSFDEMKKCFSRADILLPDFDKVEGRRWSVIACDQFTSEPEYWEAVAERVGDSPSTLNLMIPEVYLSESAERTEKAHAAMDEYLKSVLIHHPDSMIYVERTQPDGRVRRGIVGMVDLEEYEYTKGSDALIRATEGTVLSRIPPRVAVRRKASIELPHVMLLIDDPDKTVIEPISDVAGDLKVAYDFDLMIGAGHVKGSFMDIRTQENVLSALANIASPDQMEKKYGDRTLAPLLFAAGDGNHSLATAKALFEEIKSRDGESAMQSPARYALVEVVNLHDDALDFEPIYRVIFNTDTDDLLTELKKYVSALNGNSHPQKMLSIVGDREEEIVVSAPVQQLTIGTLQAFLDEYSEKHPEIEVDYIHGETALRTLAAKENAVGFLYDGMEKSELFKTVIFDGALPRKTFSMGHAKDKRFYLECRKIK
jgi:uncharacterized protein (DUF1015 family)